jgi:putative salt-induced outer membrane protein
MQRFAALFIPLALFTGSVFAQTAPKPDGLWRGSLGLGATASTGNTESATYSLNGDIVRQTLTNKSNGYLQGVYGRRDVRGATELTSDLLRAGAKHDRDLSDRTFAFGALDLERDKVIDLELRSVVATGLGYHLVRREGHTFDISTGPAYNRERYSIQTREAVEWLFAEESIHALSPTVSFRQRLSYYPSVKDSGEFRAVFDAGLVLKVTRRWSATITLNDRYQSNPLLGLKKNDLLFVTGLQYVVNP